MAPCVQKEAIAVVGIGCRLPGQSSSPSQLWQMLLERKSGHCQIPKSRFRAKAFYHPDPDRPGSMNSTSGYFLDESITSFENAFFGINNKEGSYMDAQQRKLLEVTYESLESAGVPLHKVYGSNTGVFVANFTLDQMIMQYSDPEYFTRYSATGSGVTVLANRISHCFDLRGPSSATDTACSSSLYSLHAACSSLDSHECEAALVASANLIQSPEQQLIAVKAGILSPDGICHSFDQAANGYGRAEAVSALYLKRMSDAIRDGDPVRCIIRGTAVNSNGNTPGITQPSVEGQAAVIRKAYLKAGLPMNCTDYVEAHATGTAVGDPIEVEAIGKVLQRNDGRPILIGGNKPNLGHSEGASGISSIIKVALALESCTIPATTGVEAINSNIEASNWNVEIVTEERVWPDSVLPRASINSFGFGGSNSHVVLEAAGPYMKKLSKEAQDHTQPPESQRPVLIALSARTAKSLRRMSEDLRHYLTQSSGCNVRDLCHTLTNRRSMFRERGCVLIHPYKPERSLSSLIRLEDDHAKTLPLAFVFNGQGAQWPQMGEHLIRDFPVFRQTLRRLDDHLGSLGLLAPQWSMEAAVTMSTEASTVHTAVVSQSLCTALQIALINMLADWGIVPEAVLGHSSGEIAAAYASGALSEQHAIVCAYLRGLAVTKLEIPGAMLVVGIGERAAQHEIVVAGYQQEIVVACINSPQSVTLSGGKNELERLHELLVKKGVFVRKLETGDKAYHSHHMKNIGALYQTLMDENWNSSRDDRFACCSAAGKKMISTVTGAAATLESCTQPAYWRKNLESPVHFTGAVKSLFEDARFRVIEIGPHSTLELPLKQTIADAGIHHDAFGYLPSLIRGRSSTTSMLNLAAQLYLHGYSIRLDNVNGVSKTPSVDTPKVLHDLPTYPWDYDDGCPWVQPRRAEDFRNRGYPRHDLLGSQVHHGDRSFMSWRNVLCPEKLAWLKDHQLGPTIVFPAAAYLSMAVEAVCQAHDIDVASCPGVGIRSLFLLNALAFETEQTSVEIFTQLMPDSLTLAEKSKSWWRFRVHSVVNDHCTEHAHGLVGLLQNCTKLPRKLEVSASELEEQACRTWYAKFTKEGLTWGPRFAVLEKIFCDRNRERHISSTKTTNAAKNGPPASSESQYAVHPINIDGMLQTAFIATAAGRVRDLRATVPVSIGSACIMPSSCQARNVYTVDSISRCVGLGTVNVEAELRDTSDNVLVTLKDVRCIPYAGNRHSSRADQRNPLVRMTWKPDITSLLSASDSSLRYYLEWYASADRTRLGWSENTRFLMGLLDLIVHRKPDLRILLVNGPDEEEFASAAFETLAGGSHHRRMNTCFRARIESDNRVFGTDLKDSLRNPVPDPIDLSSMVFDVVILSKTCGLRQTWRTSLSTCLESSAIVLSNSPTNAAAVHDGPSLRMSDGSHISVSAAKTHHNAETEEQIIVLVTRCETRTVLDDAIALSIASLPATLVHWIPFSQLQQQSLPLKATVVATVDVDVPMLGNMTEAQMQGLKLLTDVFPKILWLTNCNIMQGERPDFALVQGLARAIMLEQPATIFSVFDVDQVTHDVDVTAANTRHVLLELLNGHALDFEHAQVKGVLHLPRWQPDDLLNASFRNSLDGEPQETALQHCTNPAVLTLNHPGQLDTIHFTNSVDISQLASDLVEIQTHCVSINAKDLYALGARVDTTNASCSCECAGIVVKAGDSVSNFKPGDRVVGMAPGRFATFERIPEWACLKLMDNETFTDLSTIPLVYATAIYAFSYRAKLQRNESVLIHSAAGGVGIAAIQLAKHIGAKIFATVGTQAKRDFLVQHFDLNPAHIFTSRDNSFLPELMTVTEDRGVDVVLNSLTGDLLHQSLAACADFGRFVEIGKRDILDHGSMDMAIFERNISFMAFDLSSIFYSPLKAHHALWQSLLSESVQMFRSGVASHVVPPKVFEASDVVDAFRYFSSPTRTGKVVVSFENPLTIIKTVRERYSSKFDPAKAYLMVGCLGGLGRSISRWMASRGARRFVFLSRTGDERPQAQVLINNLERNGAKVVVVRGDVTSLPDVRRAIGEANACIGGVIQAAMALDEALWTTMSCKSWHTAVEPKVKGTWNIHNALLEAQKQDVDFFVMTSSISGTVGTATESNYCAGNAFLDSFARYRNRLGLNAVSIGLGMISEVGYLHEHPDIEKLLERKGIHPIDEDEMLQILDLALTQPSPRSPQGPVYYDSLATSHLLTGIEFIGLKEQRDRGFEGDNHVLADPRAALFAAAFARSAKDTAFETSASHHAALPRAMKEALQDGGKDTLLDAAREIVSVKISNLILLPVEKLGLDQHLSDFGIDSMLAAEFRTFIFHKLEVDVPFMMLLGKTTTVNSLAQTIVEALETR